MRSSIAAEAAILSPRWKEISEGFDDVAAELKHHAAVLSVVDPYGSPACVDEGLPDLQSSATTTGSSRKRSWWVGAAAASPGVLNLPDLVDEESAHKKIRRVDSKSLQSEFESAEWWDAAGLTEEEEEAQENNEAIAVLKSLDIPQMWSEPTTGGWTSSGTRSGLNSPLKKKPPPTTRPPSRPDPPPREADQRRQLPQGAPRLVPATSSLPPLPQHRPVIPTEDWVTEEDDVAPPSRKNKLHREDLPSRRMRRRDVRVSPRRRSTPSPIRLASPEFTRVEGSQSSRLFSPGVAAPRRAVEPRRPVASPRPAIEFHESQSSSAQSSKTQSPASCDQSENNYSKQKPNSPTWEPRHAMLSPKNRCLSPLASRRRRLSILPLQELDSVMPRPAPELVVVEAADGARLSFGMEDPPVHIDGGRATRNTADWPASSDGESSKRSDGRTRSAEGDDPGLLFTQEDTPLITPRPVLRSSSALTSANPLVPIGESRDSTFAPLPASPMDDVILPDEQQLSLLSLPPPSDSRPSLETQLDRPPAGSPRGRPRKRAQAAARRRALVGGYLPEKAPLLLYSLEEMPAIFREHQERGRELLTENRYPQRSRQKPLRWWMNEALVFKRPAGSVCAVVVGVRRRAVADDLFVLPTNGKGPYTKIINLPPPSSALAEALKPLPPPPEKPLALEDRNAKKKRKKNTKTATTAAAPVTGERRNAAAKSGGRSKAKSKNKRQEVASEGLQIIRRSNVAFVPVDGIGGTFEVAIVLETPQVTLCELMLRPKQEKGREKANSALSGEVIWAEENTCLVCIGDDAALPISSGRNAEKQLERRAVAAEFPVCCVPRDASYTFRLSRCQWFHIPPGVSYNIVNLSKNAELVLWLSVERPV